MREEHDEGRGLGQGSPERVGGRTDDEEEEASTAFFFSATGALAASGSGEDSSLSRRAALVAAGPASSISSSLPAPAGRCAAAPAAPELESATVVSEKSETVKEKQRMGRREEGRKGRQSGRLNGQPAWEEGWVGGRVCGYEGREIRAQMRGGRDIGEKMRRELGDKKMRRDMYGR